MTRTIQYEVKVCGVCHAAYTLRQLEELLTREDFPMTQKCCVVSLEDSLVSVVVEKSCAACERGTMVRMLHNVFKCFRCGTQEPCQSIQQEERIKKSEVAA